MFEDVGTNAARRYTAESIPTEIAVIQSRMILGRVVERLKLREHWGRKYAGGQPFTDDEALEILRSNTG